MAIIYKKEIIPELKKVGYNTTRIRREKIFSEGTLQSFREHKLFSFKVLNTLCELLDCQPGDILEYVPDEE